jgi:hypothetical protein
MGLKGKGTKLSITLSHAFADWRHMAHFPIVFMVLDEIVKLVYKACVHNHDILLL